MNRFVSSATLFLAAIMLVVSTAVAFPTVKNAVSQPAESVKNDAPKVGSPDGSLVSDTDSADKNDDLLAASTVKTSAPPSPLIAVSVIKSEKFQSQYWAMKFVVGNGDVGVDQLPPIGVGTVKLIRKGKVVGSFLVGPGGIVQVPHLSSGAYSIVARSVDGFAATGTYLAGGAENGELAVNIALVPVRESAIVDSLLARAKNDHSGYVGIRKEFRYGGDASLALQSDVVGREADGVVRIRLLELLDQYGLAQTTEGLSVHFVLNEKIVSHGITDEDGIAELQGVGNGRYAMIVTGQRRVLVTSVLVKNQIGKANGLESAVSLITDLIIGSAPVGMNQAASVSAAGTIPLEDFDAVNQPVNTGSPFGGGGGGSGGGGGGGGGGAGGGGGLFAGLAAGAAAGFLAGNNNDNNGVASP